MLRAALLLLATGMVVGCHTRTEVGLPTLDAARLSKIEADEGPWKPEEQYEVIGGPWKVANGVFDNPAQTLAVSARKVDPFTVKAPEPTPNVVHAQAPPVRKLAVPRRRARREARPVGKKTGKTTEQLAREHFLDYPTRVKARKVTLYLPPAYAREVRLTGESVSKRTNGRQQALGGARLVLRELTLEGERVTLRIRDDGRPDLQIMARGDAGFVAEVRANVLREEGLRSLLITNDQVVPIR